MMIDDTLTRMVERLSCFAVLDDVACRAIIKLPCSLKAMCRGQTLSRAGDRMTDHLVVTTGQVFRTKTVSDGGRQILSFHLRGDAVSYQTIYCDRAGHDTVAASDGWVVIIPKQAIRKLIDGSPPIAHAVTMAAVGASSILSEWLLNVTRRDARQRTAHLLRELSVRLDTVDMSNERGFEMPFTQEDLGDMLGITAVHVNRMLKLLSEDGLLVRRRSQFDLPRWHAPKQLAGFNASYLRYRRLDQIS